MKKKILSMVLFVAVLALSVAALAVPYTEETVSAYDESYELWDSTEFTELSYGIYWYVDGTNIPVAADKCTTFDPTKPTVIYTHGMKYNEATYCREGLSLKSATENALASHGFEEYYYDSYYYRNLLKTGYNVGVFYWNQMSDCMPSGEVKFWSITDEKGRNSMQYTYRTDTSTREITAFDDERNPEITVTKMYRDAIINALGKDFSGHLQLAGHSMGGQLTMAVSQALCYSYDNGDIGENLLPDRVTCIDPYLGSRKIYGTVDTTGEEVNGKTAAALAAEACQTVAKHGIPIEAFGANLTAFNNYDLAEGMCITNADGERDAEEIDRIKKLYAESCVWVYLDGIEQEYKSFIPTHTMAVDYYFTTQQEKVCFDNTGMTVPSFNVSDEVVRNLRGLAFRQTYKSSMTDANPLYSSESDYVRYNIITMEDDASENMNRLVGTVTSKDEVEVVLKDADGNEIARTVALGGVYAFDHLSVAEYTAEFFVNGKSKGEQTVNCSDQLSVQEEEFVIKKSSSKKTTESKNGNIGLYVGIGAGVLVLILLIVLIARGKKNRRRS